jgi:hypothetical protein
VIIITTTTSCCCPHCLWNRQLYDQLLWLMLSGLLAHTEG